MERELEEKYEAYIARLQEELAELEVSRKRIPKLIVGVVTAPLGLFWSLTVALIIAAWWVGLVAVAAYLNRSRRWYTKTELTDTRRTLEQLKTGALQDAAREGAQFTRQARPAYWKA